MIKDNLGYKFTSMSKLGKILENELQRQGITQDQLAQAIGATQPAIAKIVSGKTQKSRFLTDIAEYLGVSTNYLKGIEEQTLITNINESPEFNRLKMICMQLSPGEIAKGVDYFELLMLKAKNTKKTKQNSEQLHSQ